MIGKFKVPSSGGAVYCHDFVERKSKMCWAYPVKHADSETFIEAFRELMAFIGKRPKVLRVDAGNNYTSDEVKKFCLQLEIQIQTAVVKAPHQIAQGGRTHGVLMSTTRAIMNFAYARYELWALGIKYAAVLNNHMAVDYTSHDDAHVPWMSLSSSLDLEHLYIFGCLVIMHQGKDESTTASLTLAVLPVASLDGVCSKDARRSWCTQKTQFKYARRASSRLMRRTFRCAFRASDDF